MLNFSILLSFTLFLCWSMGTDDAVIFKFISLSKHTRSSISTLKIGYSNSDAFANSKTYSKNVLFIITTIVFYMITLCNFAVPTCSVL